MPDVPVPPEEVKDPWEKNCPGKGLGRDPVRSPMPWDDSENAGFSAGRPWLPLTPDWRSRNVAAQQSDPGSLLNLYRRLIALRRQEPALHSGTYRPIPAGGDFLLFFREDGRRRLLVALNFRSGAGGWRPRGDPAGRILLSTFLDRERERFRGRLELRGNEGVIAEME
jgi:alpha-glucosidase